VYAVSQTSRSNAPSPPRAYASRLCPTGHALLLEGEAGKARQLCGWRRSRAAEDRGFRALQARSAESESRLSYAALADIVGAAFDGSGRLTQLATRTTGDKAIAVRTDQMTTFT
jgi:hypothetical protein